ncbi:MAG: hypothetical protein KDJ65_14610 [Anaerolineae bacterium]|nr:hypothetical protein [Anaerolineae bacterium]
MVFSHSKSVALPTEGCVPQPDAVDKIVHLALACDMSVCIITFNQAMRDYWQQASASADPAQLDILDANRATLADWLDYMLEHEHHLTILSGAYTDLQAGLLSADYIQLLIEAIPEGLVVLA